VVLWSETIGATERAPSSHNKMQSEKVLLVLRHEGVVHRLKFFRCGSQPTQDDLLLGVCRELGCAAGTTLRFLDEDGDSLLLNSCIPSGTQLTVLADSASATDPYTKATASATKLAIDRLCAAEVALAGADTAATSLSEAVSLLRGMPALDAIAQAYKAVRNVASGSRPIENQLKSFKADPRMEAAIAVRDCLVLRCFCDFGQVDGYKFIEEMRKVFGPEHAGDNDLWSSLRVAHQRVLKSHFGVEEQGARHKKNRGKKKRPPEQSSEDTSNGERTPGPEDMPRRVDLSKCTALQPVVPVVRRTFWEVEEDEVQSIREIESNPSALTWPGIRQFTPKNKRLVKKLIETITDSGQTSAVCGSKAQTLSALLAKMPFRDEAMISTHAQPLVLAARCHAADPDCLKNILCALSKVSGPHFLEDLEPLLNEMEAKAVAQCCTSLGDYISGDGFENKVAVVERLLEVMEHFNKSPDVQEACLSTLVKVWRTRQEVLGIQCARQPESDGFKRGTRKRLVRFASELLVQNTSCAEWGIRLLARASSLQVVMDAVRGHEHHGSLLSTALHEVCYTLEQPLSALYGIEDHAEEVWARDLLRQVGQQSVTLGGNVSPVNWVVQLDASMSNWERRHKMEQRFHLVGLLFGAEAHVLTPMVEAASSKNTDHREIAELMSSACRALINLNDQVVPFGCELACRIGKKAMTCMDQLRKKSGGYSNISMHVRSSYVGLLGSVRRGGAKLAEEGKAADPMDEVGEVLKCAQVSMGEWWKAAPLLHEALWALVEMFKGADSLGAFGAEIQALAQQLDTNFKDVPWCNEDQKAVVRFCKLILGGGWAHLDKDPEKELILDGAWAHLDKDPEEELTTQGPSD